MSSARPPGASYPDRVLLCELWQRTSARRKPYLAGFLGKAKLVAFQKEGDLPDGAEAVWQVYVTPGKEGGR